MIKLTARESISEDCEYIADHTRLSDIAEVKITEGKNAAIRDVVHRSFSNSEFGFCVTWFTPSNIPLAISGIIASPLTYGVGLPWMLGTTDMFKYPRQILTESKKFIKIALESQFKYLYNYVQDANKPSKRYLKAIGFKLYELEPKGPYDEPFRKFDMGNPQICNTILAGGVIA